MFYYIINIYYITSSNIYNFIENKYIQIEMNRGSVVNNNCISIVIDQYEIIPPHNRENIILLFIYYF